MGPAFPSDCTGCHGGNLSGAAAIRAADTPPISTTPQSSAQIGCVDCHAKTVTADRTITSGTSHANGFVEYSGVSAGGSSSYTTATGVCTDVYCHTDGKGSMNAPFVAGTGWNSSVVYGDCKGCHGNDTQSGYFTSTVGEPNYANRARDWPGPTPTAVSHVGAGSPPAPTAT